MFADPCLVSSGETALFIVFAAAFGVSIAMGLCWLIQMRFARQGIKVGCLAMTLTGLLAGYLAKLALPDRRAYADCGFTPDIVFFPGYAFIVAPFAMLAALFFFLRVRRRG
jgi:hypothetical protein